MKKINLKKIIDIIKNKMVLRLVIGIIIISPSLVASVFLKDKDMIISSILIIVGAFMNILVVFSNRFKMPVLRLQKGLRIKSERHFLYNPKDKIKFKILTDRFVLGYPITKKGIIKDFITHQFSIGDILLILGFILFYTNILF